MKHPNLSDEINENLAQSERDGGVSLKSLCKGDEVQMITANSTYTIKKTGPEDYLISGNNRYCPQPTPCKIHGSTWGGSMLKIGFIGIGMHLEFSTKDHRRITTSTIATVAVTRIH